MFDHGVHTGTCLPILQILGCVSNAWFPNNAWIPNMVAGLTSNVVTTFRISRARDLLFTNITIMMVIFLCILCHKGDFGLGFFPFLYQFLTGLHEHLGLFHWLEPLFCAFPGEGGIVLKDTALPPLSMIRTKFGTTFSPLVTPWEGSCFCLDLGQPFAFSAVPYPWATYPLGENSNSAFDRPDILTAFSRS